MKNIKNYFKLILILVLSSVTLNSCLLDDEKTDFGKGPILTQFTNPNTEINIIKDAANTPVIYTFEVTYFGGRNVLLDRDVQVSLATSATSEAKEGVEFELTTKTLTILAGSSTATGSIKILTGALVPFDFKDVVIEITNSSESISEVNTITIKLKAIGANSLAGRYEIIDSNYWRLGVNRGNYNTSEGGIRIIEALSETTYKHPDYFGLFGGEFYFSVNSSDKVTVLTHSPIDGKPIFQGTAPIITCENSALLVNAPCAGSNYVKRTNDRHDIIYLTYGYNTPGAREFYEVLRRLE